MRTEGKILCNLAVSGLTISLIGRYSKNLPGTLLQGTVAAISGIALPLIFYNESEDRSKGFWPLTTGALFLAGHLGLSCTKLKTAFSVSYIALSLIYLTPNRTRLHAAAVALHIATYLALPSLRVILIGTVALSFLQEYISTSAIAQEELVSDLKKLNSQELNPEEFKRSLINFNLLHPQYKPNALNGVEVNGDCNLWAPHLTSLPTSLTIHGSLNLLGCRSLTSLPIDLTADGNLDLSYCSMLTSLPSWITQLGSKADGSVRHVHLSNTGVSRDVIDHLMQENPVGMQFHFGLANSGEEVSPVFPSESIETAVSFWERLLPKKHGIDKVQLEIENDHEKQSFMSYLARLKGTAEYNNPQTQSFLAQRITLVLKAMEKDAEFTAFVISKIDEALISCNDGIIQTLDFIEQQTLISNAEKTGNAEELRELGIRFFKLDLMHTKIRKDIIPYMRFVDKVEVDLAFEIRLSERLDLPRQTKNMLFRRYPGLKDEQIDEVGKQVLKESTPEAIEDYLKLWGPWQRHLRRQEVAKATYEQLSSVQGKREAICIINHTATDQPVVVRELEEPSIMKL